MNYPSKLIETAVEEISNLPGIGKKTALRLALHIIKQDEEFATNIGEAIIQLRKGIKYCKSCYNIADEDLCQICASKFRDKTVICVVEDTPDVMAVENTAQFKGLYHVLGGCISPMEGITPAELKIQELVDRVKSDGIKEIILALSSTMEGDTTAFYITKKLKEHTELKISTIARGVPIGGELEYTDEVTLGRSILNRVDYK